MAQHVRVLGATRPCCRAMLTRAARRACRIPCSSASFVTRAPTNGAKKTGVDAAPPAPPPPGMLAHDACSNACHAWIGRRVVTREVVVATDNAEGAGGRSNSFAHVLGGRPLSMQDCGGLGTRTLHPPVRPPTILTKHFSTRVQSRRFGKSDNKPGQHTCPAHDERHTRRPGCSPTWGMTTCNARSLACPNGSTALGILR